MSDINFTSFLPETTDSERLLLAKLLALGITRKTGTALASATRTVTTQSATIESRGARGIIAWINVSSASGTGGLNLALRGVDPVIGGNSLLMQQSASMTTTGLRAFSVHPGNGAAVGTSWANMSVAGAPLPSKFVLSVTHADASNYTYSVTYELIP
jgi:hypothetical protein